MKRHRSSETENSLLEKRLKEANFMDEEIELRDKFLDELSSNPSSQESGSNQTNQMEVDNDNHDQQRKIIKLEGPLPNLALPDGWIAINHRSGGIIYLHRATRVCTWARPYYLGKGSIRKHDVPVAAIPCLHQKKALVNKHLQTQEHLNSPCQNPPGSVPPGRGSILNFLNTAGSMVNQIEQVNDSSGGDNESGKEDGNHQGDTEGVVCSNTNESVSRSTEDSTIINRAHTHTHNESFAAQKAVDGNGDGSCTDGEISDGGNGSYSNSDIVDGGGGDRGSVVDDGNHGDNEIDDGFYSNGNIVDDGVGGNHGIVADGSNKIDDGNYGNNEIGCSDVNNHSNNEIVADFTANCFNPFHPKDGLDVVNDALRVYSEDTQSADKLPKDNSAEFDRISPILPHSSKPDFYKEILQSTSFKSIENDELRKIPNNANDFKEDFSVASNKEDNVNQTPCTTSVAQTAESEHSNSSEDQSKSNILNNYPMKSEHTDIPNNVHQKSGIDLIDAEDLNTYFGRIFEFEELTIHQEQNAIKTSSQSIEQVDTVLTSALECLPYCVKGKTAKENKGWVLNPGGKTPVAILHEYSQAVLKEKPVYVSSECDNGTTPFMAELQINGITYGSGVASSKKQAKQIAAEVALEVFLPDVFHKIRDYVISREELECFDKLKVDDHQVYEVSVKSGIPSPSQVLQECLKRNQGVCSSTINFKIVPGENQNHSFKISCGKHSAEGFCKNKKIGKQLASQALLMKLHPHISTWGSLLRIYCDRPSSIVKKYKTSDEESLMNTIASTPDTPRGQILLDRLKQEMRKIANEKQDPSEYLALNDTSSISTVDI